MISSSGAVYFFIVKNTPFSIQLIISSNLLQGCHPGAVQLFVPAVREGPSGRITVNLTDFGHEEGIAGFMTGLEVENLSVAALEAASASEYFAAIVMADKD